MRGMVIGEGGRSSGVLLYTIIVYPSNDAPRFNADSIITKSITTPRILAVRRVNIYKKV